MKLFGGGKQPVGASKSSESKEEDASYFDSPSENVSLSAPTPQRQATVIVEEPPATQVYGIDQAIQLMRSLPLDQNPALVVAVIKTTLESLRVRVPDIIADATRKQTELEVRVDTLTKEIVDFEREIAQRKEEIGRLEADHRETSSVKQRLEQAEAGGTAAAAKSKPAKTGS